MRTWILAFFLLVVVIASAAALWLRHELTTPYYGPSAPEVFVDIPRGIGSEKIASLLVQAGVLRTQLPFLIHLRRSGQSRQLKAGEYRFAGPATPEEIVDRLVRGNIYYHSVTIPEGLTAEETIALVAGKGLANLRDLRQALRRTDWIRAWDPRATDLEGYLFPETYRYSRTAGAQEIIKSMVDRFRSVFEPMREEHRTESGLDVRSLVTLASIVEKEVRHDHERALVASVLYNRLELGMPLACDPTVIYALRLEGRFDGNIRKQDLSIDSPYNTYIRTGLPPGPIANPGTAALRSVLSPAKTDFLYFVSRNDGTHHFSKDFRSHDRAVARFQKGARRD